MEEELKKFKEEFAQMKKEIDVLKSEVHQNILNAIMYTEEEVAVGGEHRQKFIVFYFLFF